jgi:hypothetical protein
VRNNKNAYRVLVGKPEGKKPLGRPRRVRIILNSILRDTEWGAMEKIHLAHDRDAWRAPVNTVTNLQIP